MSVLGEGGVDVRPLLVACSAFLAGAFFGISVPWWVALLALPLLHWRPLRPLTTGLTLGLLRGAAQDHPPAFTLPEEFEARVVAPDLVG